VTGEREAGRRPLAGRRSFQVARFMGLIGQPGCTQRSTWVWWALWWQRPQPSGFFITLGACGPLWQSTHDGTVG
jgi:hypothetical protein